MIPLGPHPPVTLASRFLDLIDQQAWNSDLATKRVNTHQDEVIIVAFIITLNRQLLNTLDLYPIWMTELFAYTETKNLA